MQILAVFYLQPQQFHFTKPTPAFLNIWIRWNKHLVKPLGTPFVVNQRTISLSKRRGGNQHVCFFCCAVVYRIDYNAIYTPVEESINNRRWNIAVKVIFDNQGSDTIFTLYSQQGLVKRRGLHHGESH